MKNKFITEIKKFSIDTEYALIKPGWVSDEEGVYTEAAILDWLLEALPEQKKIIIESYTPWRSRRSPISTRPKNLQYDLEGGKEFWDFYKKQDQEFLEKTDLGEVLKKHQAEYVNITGQYWAGKCVEPDVVRKLVGGVEHEDFYNYIPRQIFDIREEATLISLAKIKTEPVNPNIMASLAVKNIFGLLPHPSRWSLHGEDHKDVASVVRDINKIYTSLFKNTLWIAEGINSWVENYMSPDTKIRRDEGLLFLGRRGSEVDREACGTVGVDPDKVPYL